MDALPLEARQLDDVKARARGRDAHRRFDLESRGRCDLPERPAPERRVAEADVGVLGAEQQVHQRGQRACADPPQACQVVAAAAVEKARPLHHVGARSERRDEPRDVPRIGRSVGVDGHDDVTGGGGEAERKRIPLAGSELPEHAHLRPEPSRGGNGRVARPAVHDDHLVQIAREPFEDARKVLRLVERRNDHADERPQPHETALALCGRLPLPRY